MSKLEIPLEEAIGTVTRLVNNLEERVNLGLDGVGNPKAEEALVSGVFNGEYSLVLVMGANASRRSEKEEDHLTRRLYIGNIDSFIAWDLRVARGELVVILFELRRLLRRFEAGREERSFKPESLWLTVLLMGSSNEKLLSSLSKESPSLDSVLL